MIAIMIAVVIVSSDRRHRRELAEQILERQRLKLAAAKFIQPSQELSSELYSMHKGRSFYEGLVNYLSSMPVLVMVWEAEGVVEIVRRMLGATFGYQAEPGTIRGDFSASKGYNLVHGSDSPESAKREIGLFFKSEEIVDYEFSDAQWLYGRND